MKSITKILSIVFMLSLVFSGKQVIASGVTDNGYERALWIPIHFKPAIDSTPDSLCLACHQEILSRKVLKESPAGVQSKDTLAWYQTLHSYEGEQETFHRRHLVTPLAKELMDLKCNTCHQGHDPREEAPIPPDTNNKGFTLRKVVNPDICLMCHGANNYKIMGMPAPWSESRDAFQDNCLLCHAGIRTKRHQVNFLKADAIEKAGTKNSDVCYGCHGGRQWYKIPYPYARNAWDGMSPDVPDWAKDRPTESEPRFRLDNKQAAK